MQNDNGAWTRVSPGANSTFTFAITSAGGIAYVTGGANNYATTVILMSGSEASSIASASICASIPQTGTRSLTTNALNTGLQNVTVTLGGAVTTFSTPSPPSAGTPFTLSNFPEGRRDLIAARSVLQMDGLTGIQRLVLRRNTAYPPSATPPAINFAGPESFAPLARVIALSNLAGDQSSISESFLTANGVSESFFESIGRFYPGAGTDGVPWAAVPDSLLLPSDFHAFFIGAAPQGGNVNTGRFAALMLHTAPSQAPAASVALGPPLATPAVTSLGTAPNVRMRAQLPSQAAYNAAAGAAFSQDSISVEVSGDGRVFARRAGDVDDRHSGSLERRLRPDLGSQEWLASGLGGQRTWRHHPSIPWRDACGWRANRGGRWSASPGAVVQLVRSRRAHRPRTSTAAWVKKQKR